MEAIVAGVGALVLVVEVVEVGLGYAGGVHSVPLFLWAGSRGTSATPAGPLLVVMGAKRPRPGLTSVRATAAGNGLYDLDLFAGTGVLDKVPDVDDPLVAGVRMTFVSNIIVESVVDSAIKPKAWLENEMLNWEGQSPSRRLRAWKPFFIH